MKLFLGIPYAQPPVGELRWKSPKPVQPWSGVRMAKAYGNDPIQHNSFPDMMFEGPKQSEDCLYLNVWTPAKTESDKLPVLIYFNGGGLLSGSGSERRYQGLRLSCRGGIVVVTANYREGVLGFFSYPELSKEGDAKGNQGWMDQAAAIKWVYENISAFGGDPKRITIVGESAGSMSVCAQMASPMSRGMLAGVMCSSGSVLANAEPHPLKDSEKVGLTWAKKNGFKNLKELRKASAEQLQKLDNGEFCFQTTCIDGKFLTESPAETYRKGEQAQVPAIIGNSNTEMPMFLFSGGKPLTMENVSPAVKAYFGTDAKSIFDLYDIHSNKDLKSKPGYELGGDMFIAYATWKWGAMLRQTSKQPVYRYIYCHPRPVRKGQRPAVGAAHATDINYALGNLSTDTLNNYQADDYAMSEIFQQVYINFVKNGNPNGLGMPQWDAYNGSNGKSPYMLLDVESKGKELPQLETRYKTIDALIEAAKTKKK